MPDIIIPSPYLWSGTTVYERGKYVADGRFSAIAVDKQIGCAAILKELHRRKIK
jgi:lysozyme family protein